MDRVNPYLLFFLSTFFHSGCNYSTTNISKELLKVVRYCLRSIEARKISTILSIFREYSLCDSPQNLLVKELGPFTWNLRSTLEILFSIQAAPFKSSWRTLGSQLHESQLLIITILVISQLFRECLWNCNTN